MKKLLILFCLLLSFKLSAQTVKTLLHQGDSLRKLTKYEQAAKLYDKAISNVVSYKENIENGEWMRLSLASQEANSHIIKTEKPHYINNDYRENGVKFKEKIEQLKAQGAKSIFTFFDVSGMSGSTYIITDSVTMKKICLGDSYIMFLVWLENNKVFMRAYGSCNVYKPLKLSNKPLIKLLQAHHDELATEVIKKNLRFFDESSYNFEFYANDKVYKKNINDPKDIKDPSINANAYLTHLLPLIKEELPGYLRRTKTE